MRGPLSHREYLLLAGLAVSLIAAGVVQWTTREKSPVRTVSSTAMLVRYDLPYPWPSGNVFSIGVRDDGLQPGPASWLDQDQQARSRWNDVNMYAENFTEISKQQRIRQVEVERLGLNYCAIVDSRIPRSWLSKHPLRLSVPKSRRLRLERPELFAVNPEADALVGTAWSLRNRTDPDGFLARLLPGDRIEFQRVDLVCTTSELSVPVLRTWQLLRTFPTADALKRNPGDAEPKLSFSVYDVAGEVYEGIAGELNLVGNEMTFIIGLTLKGEGEQESGSCYRVKGNDAYATYVRETQ